MKKESVDFLLKLLQTPSPSGFEQGIQKIIRRRMSKYADEITVDVHGNLIASFNPEGRVRVMLAGHCDQIGFMVHHIDDKGFVYFGQIGGIDPSVLPGTQVQILGREKTVPGVIGHKPVHLVPQAERGKKIELSQLWIDIGAENKAHAEKLVSVGDPITYVLEPKRLGQHVLVSPACDDKVGAFIVMEALRLVSSKMKGAEKRRFPVALFSVSTVQEELGLRGARTSCFGLDPHVGIAVDVTHAADNPGADPKRVGMVKLGKGPTISRGANINPVVEELLVSTAKKKRIAYQPQSAPGATGTDANAIQITRAGVAAGLIGIPNRYMHTQVEMVDLRDIEAAAKLLAESIIKITARKSFIPA